MDYLKKLLGYGVVNENTKIIQKQSQYDTFDKNVEQTLKKSMLYKESLDKQEIEKLESYKEPRPIKFNRKTNMHDI